MEVKTVGIASDHAAFPLKQFVKRYLEEKGMEYKDYGTYTEDSCNDATYGHALAEDIERGEVYPGIAMCGSGEGISWSLHLRGNLPRVSRRILRHRVRWRSPSDTHRRHPM